MEDLNKTQIILLGILVSFVTSIATSIITTSLLDQAPPQVGRTVNRVVERTIERVVPEDSEKEVTQEVVKETVVVKEDDMVVGAVEKNVPHRARIFPQGEEGVSLGIGFVVSEKGVIATDGGIVQQDAQYSVVIEDTTYAYTTLYDPEDRIAFLVPTEERSLTPVTFSGTNPQLGQTVVAIGGGDTPSIAVGRITSLTPSSGQTGTTTKEVNISPIEPVIVTDIMSPSIGPGSLLVNLSGEVIGMNIQAHPQGYFTPSTDIQAAYTEATK